MSIAMQAAQANWKNLSAAELANALPDSITITDIPALPLANAADMPPQVGFTRGSLAINLSSLKLNLRKQDAAVQIEQNDASTNLLAIRVAGISLHGLQTLHGTQIWENGLDGAGTSLPFGVKMRGGADGDTDVHPTWIATANAQRAALQNVQGGNGATLLSAYANHRAAFTDVFTTPGGGAFQNGWASDAISQMAQDTNDNVNSGGVINSSTKIYGSTTYNGNAQTQQLALITALTGMANGQDPSDPYNQAAASVVTFANSTVQNTGTGHINDIPEQTKDNVYAHVASGKPAQQVSVADVHAYLNGSQIGGRDAQGNTWSMMLNEDERAFVRKQQAEQAEIMARLAAAKPVPIAQASLKAELSCFVYLQFSEQEQSVILQDGRVELDGFDLEFDDSQWDALLGQPLAEQVRAALADARFIKSLLHDRIADALERALVPALSQVLLGAK